MRSLPFLALALTLAAGCASDPNRRVLHAEEAQAREQQAAQERQMKLAQEHAEEQAALTRRQREERAELRGDTADERAASDRKLINADATMYEERQEFEARARERLQKCDARANELTVKVNKANAKTRSEVTSDWDTYSRQREVALRQINGMANATNGEWKVTKGEVEKQLDALETIVKRIDRKL